MKLKNSTDWPNHFLRRMVAWCCKQLSLPVRRVRKVEFRNRTTAAFSGHAYGSRRIVVSIGPESMFPRSGRYKKAAPEFHLANRTEALIHITAHELEHLVQYWEHAKTVEAWNEVEANRVLDLFRAQRESLLGEWSATLPEKPKPDICERRALKAQADLDRWTRKLKLAKTKCAKLRQRVAYYERRQAAKST